MSELELLTPAGRSQSQSACLGFAVLYPGMDLMPSPGRSLVFEDADGSHRAHPVLISSYLRLPVQAPATQDFFTGQAPN